MTAMLNVNSGELTTVRLYGKLGAKFGRVHRIAVASAAEAVRALCCQLPDFEKYLTESKDNGMGYSVFYGKQDLQKESLSNPCFGEDIRIAPMLLGSKNGGWFNVILGAVIVIASFVIDYFTGGAFGAATGYATYSMGFGLIVGGIVQLLAPAPKGVSSKDRPENQSSYAFNGAINTQAQGNPVMVVYGECITGSAVLSAGINAVDQAYVPSDGSAGGSGGGGGGGAPPWHGDWSEAV